ncbi:unnamed protein product [Rotaria sordida]|uniref:Phospholipid scramblase n=1 Tax=Rotaria sordida TaxID=392033 RepID=A0A814IKJ5_9BILA|nr:unnamed protein product [Rotaria sordida]
MLDQVHLTIVTSLSIIITFVLHYIMNDIPVRQTYLQVSLIDFLRDLGLTIRCLYNQGINNITCLYFFIQYDAFDYRIYTLFLSILFGSDRTTEIGAIYKKYSGFCKEAFTSSDVFSMHVPINMDVKAKMLVLGALFLIDFMNFSLTPQQQS